MSKEELIWIEIGKIDDRQVPFGLWVEQKIAGPVLTDRDGNLQPAIRKDCGNCYIVMALNQNLVLRDRCKFEGIVGWEPVGDDSPEASDKMQIAWFISNELPNREFVKDFKTLDQLYEWMEWKNNCIWIAKCFVAGHGSPDNPLLRPLEEGEIDQYYHDFCWLTVDLYENLWKLINLKTRRIKAAFNKQGWVWPFESPRQLLEEIIATDINGEFSNILKPRYERNVKELKRLAKLAHRSYKGFLAPKDRTELARLKEKHSQPNVWLKRLLDVSRLLGETDEFIRVRVAIHDEILRGVCKLELDAACQPEWRRHGQISELWIDGVKRPGINNGWQA
jgi:hypothetical protein